VSDSDEPTWNSLDGAPNDQGLPRSTPDPAPSPSRLDTTGVDELPRLGMHETGAKYYKSKRYRFSNTRTEKPLEMVFITVTLHYRARCYIRTASKSTFPQSFSPNLTKAMIESEIAQFGFEGVLRLLSSYLTVRRRLLRSDCASLHPLQRTQGWNYRVCLRG
jgi:hypothetical protein